MRLPRLNNLNVARAVGAGHLGFLLAVTRNAVDLLSAGMAVALLVVVGHRRWRFPAAVALGISGCQHLLGLARTNADTAPFIAASSVCAALAAVALLWPRRAAEREDAALPQLSGSWALLSTLVVSACHALLLYTADPNLMADPRGALFKGGFAALLLFGGFMFASLSGPLRWPLQLVAAAASVAVSMQKLFAISGGPPESFVQQAAMAAPALAFAFSFDWIRSGRTAAHRMARSGSLVAMLGLLPSLLAAPHQAFAPLALARLLALAAAYAVSAGLAPRVASRRRPVSSPRDTRAPWVVAASVAGAMLLPLAAVAYVVVSKRPSTVPAAPESIVLLAVMFTPFFSWRVARAALWLMAMVPMLLLGVDSDAGFFAFLGTAIAGFSSWLLSSPAVSQHFRRRARGVALPAPRASLALGVAAAALAMVTVAWNLTPAGRAELLAQTNGPVTVRAPLLYAPALPQPQPDGLSNVGSALAVDPLGRGTWVVDEEQNEVMLSSGEKDARRIVVGAWPQQLVVAPDGTVFVSCRERGTVAVIGTDFAVRSVEVGAEPRGLALGPGGGLLYVGLVTGRALVALDTATLAVVARRELPSAPYAVAVVGQTVAALPRLGSRLVLASLDLRALHEEELPPTAALAWHGQALAPAGDDLLVTYAAVDTGLSAPVQTGGEGYGGGAVRFPVELRVALLHDGHFIVTPAPLAQKLGADGSDITAALVHRDTLYLASRGTGSLLSLELSTLAAPRLKDRVPLGQGLNGLAVDGAGNVISFAAFDRKLVGAAKPTALSPSRLDPELALGRQLFHRSDDTRTSGAALACATCHPDGREDGLTWRLKGTRVQTPMLAAKLGDTAPYNWHGTSKTLEENVGQTIARLGGSGISDSERRALARYLREGLHAPVKPPPSDKALVALGRDVFTRASVGCSDCHTLDGTLTDGARHDVGTLTAAEREELAAAHDVNKDPASFDTPSLLGVALTPPYFHDGSVPSLETLIATNGDRMGHTSALSQREKTALVAFLKTL